ncbi:hypothetical protein EVAR_16775_1 [Eumeta japonica]|uniref:Uncharacterized protein n=1 Tax=Eumeta variegata TaxID=151549 RepID=A0A4C1UMK2_EUMVA|nr:hypothetical protein EVAR_16775_1 [Eumeta japonica]
MTKSTTDGLLANESSLVGEIKTHWLIRPCILRGKRAREPSKRRGFIKCWGEWATETIVILDRKAATGTDTLHLYTL